MTTIREKTSKEFAQLSHISRKARVTVGIHEAEGNDQHTPGLSIAALGEIHEFGLGVPQRSFIRAWSDEEQAENVRLLKSELRKSLKDGQVETHLDRAALKMASNVQARMVAGITPPLADATIARKGSSTPLIDTGALRASITGKAEIR